MYNNFVIPVKRNQRTKYGTLAGKATFYKCLYCSREYKKEEDAKNCVDKHDLVLVPIAKNDLGRLSQFLYLKNDELLTESLVNTIKSYARKIKRE